MVRLALLRKTKPNDAPGTVADLEAALKELELESSQAADALAKLKASRNDVLLNESDEAAKKHDDHTADLGRRLDRANARIEALREEIEQRKVEEAERAKRAERAEVEKKVEAARKALAGYEAHAKAIVRIIAEIAAADAAVEAFQRAHPDAERIAGAEEMRARPAEPEKVIKREVIAVWVYADTRAVVPDHLLESLRASERTGMVDVVSYSGTRTVPVIQVDHERVTLIPAAAARRVEKLASSISLPAFMGGDRALWEPVSSPYGSEVLARLERRSASRAMERQPETLLRPIQEGQR
jgi:hypothetical protein